MKVEELREELHECIELYGTSDKRTVEKSQELDQALNRETI